MIPPIKDEVKHGYQAFCHGSTEGKGFHQIVTPAENFSVGNAAPYQTQTVWFFLM
jgi:hypothetical protein